MEFSRKLNKEEKLKYIAICELIWGGVPVDVDWAMKTNIYKEMEVKLDNWISVEKELPVEKTKVIVCGIPIGICTAYYWGCGHKNVPSDACKGWSIMNVTHWMPLPKLPNGEYEK
jgi:hypothetical protein